MNRGVWIVLVCEDQEQQSLLLCYLKHCGVDTSRDVDRGYVPPRLPGVPSQDGAGDDRVRQQFVKELPACRKRSTKRKALLVVMIDADKWDYDARREWLDDGLEINGQDRMRADDPLVLFVPKRHVETWIRAALRQEVNETDSYKNPAPTKPELRKAAGSIYDWSRENATPAPTCVPSLQAALPGWRKIG